MSALSEELIHEELKKVIDPELFVNIVDLGLIYNVEVEDGDVHVEMTLTAQGCGMGPYIAQQAEWQVAELDDVEDVEVDVEVRVAGTDLADRARGDELRDRRTCADCE